MSVIQQELIHSIKEIAKEKKLSDDFVVAAVKDAIIKEYTREYVDANVDVEFDLANNNFAVYRVYTIVSDGLGEDFDDYLEITLDDAKLFNPNAQVGGTIKKEVLLEKLDKKLIQNI
jgi:N utilization substance protein A